MKNNYKKGFSLAEVLVIFLLISIMLAAFAPLMTRKSKKKTVNPNCPTGTKKMMVEYMIPGTYTFTAPENITGNALVTLVGGGGKGGNSAAKRKVVKGEEVEYITVYYATGGGGGGGGAFVQQKTTIMPGEYQVVVGNSSENTTFNNDITASAGGDGTDGVVAGDIPQAGSGGQGGNSGGPTGSFVGQMGSNGCSGSITFTIPGEGVPPIVCTNNGSGYEYGMGGRNSVLPSENIGGKQGEFCPSDNYCPTGTMSAIHGKQGRGYEPTNTSLGFLAGLGGGGGGIYITEDSDTLGFGGLGGGGYARIDYEVRCE